jgi:hypothetical protein
LPATQARALALFAPLERSCELIIEDEAQLLGFAKMSLAPDQRYITCPENLPMLPIQIACHLFDDEQDWWYKRNCTRWGFFAELNGGG